MRQNPSLQSSINSCYYIGKNPNNSFLYALVTTTDIPVYLLRRDTVAAAAALFVSGNPLVPYQGTQVFLAYA